MTEILYRADQRLSAAYHYLRADRKRSAAAGVLVYTLFFAVYFCVSLLPYFTEAGTIMGYDSISQYYPYLIEFRKDLGIIFDGLANGTPVFPSMNFDFAYGCDMYTTMTSDFLPFLPYYIFSVFVPESGLAFFYGVGTVLFAYISGLSFIYLCAYFKRDTLAAGFFAPLYVFAGAGFYTGFKNQAFLIMYITFPFLIAGIDKIIRSRGFLMFALAVFTTAFGDFGFLIYTIPFVVLFALIRVRFVYREHYFANLGKCFIRGFGAFLLGAALAGFLLLPSITAFFDGARSAGVDGIDLVKMFTPDIAKFTGTLVPDSYHFDTGILAALIPFLMYLFLRRGGTEIKVYILVMLALITLPLIRWGLNGFNYAICRWGFIPALLFTFAGEYTARSFVCARKRTGTLFAVFSVVYILLVTLGLGTAAAVLFAAAGLISIVPFAAGAVRWISGKLSRLRENDELYSKLKLVVISVTVLVGICAAFYIIVFVKSFIPALILVCAVSAVAVPVLARAPKVRSLVCAVYICLLTASVIMTFDPDDRLSAFSPEPLDEETYDIAVNKPKELDDGVGFGRISMMWAENKIYSYKLEETEEENGEDAFETVDNETVDEQVSDESVTGQQNTARVEVGSDSYGDPALRYGIPDTYIFKSSIDSDLMIFMKRIGQDFNSAYSKVDIQGFSGKEAIYSLFGVRYMIFPYEFDRFFGIEPAVIPDDGSGQYLYINKYALPAGITYSCITDSERFGMYDSAELPFAMFNELYLEGYDGPKTETQASYARRCDFTNERRLRGTIEQGIDVYDNTVTINDDTSGCFLFLSFEGVDARTVSGVPSIQMTVTADERYVIDARLHNRDYDWEWAYKNDRYSIALGYFPDAVKKLEFITAFDYEESFITAVPASEYVNAYNERTKDILEDLRFSVNTLEGKITVSEPKALCVSLIHSKGWRAYVDGVETPVYKANGLFLGLMLDTGEHTVRLEYTTPMLFEGVCVSLFALAVTIVCGIISKRRRTQK